MRMNKVISVDEAIEELSECFKNMNSILDRVQIKDAKYSKHFDDNVRNALITVAMIKAFGMCGKAECYLLAVKNVVTELTTAESKVKKEPCCNHDSKVGKKILTGVKNAIKDSFDDHIL